MFLPDTNVVSELRKIRRGRADENVAQWADSVDAVDLYLLSITVQELELGASPVRMPGRHICGARRIRSIVPVRCRWRRGASLETIGAAHGSC